jgi:drug/metabolite transporter (DMT)-like permease
LAMWVLLALTSAVSIACADAATKRYFSDANMWDTLVVRVVLTGFVMSPWVIMNTEPPSENIFWWWVLGLAVLDIIALFLYASAITRSPLSHTLPYLGLAPVFSAITSYFILGEQLTAAGIGGVLLVALGAYRLNCDDHEQGLLGPLRFLLLEKGPRYMLAVALIFGLTATLGKGALIYMPAEQFGPFYAMMLGLIVATMVVAKRRPVFAIVNQRPVASMIVSSAMSVMVLTHFLAMQLTEVSYMIAIKRTSAIFGLLLGAWLFKEANLGKNLFACAIMIAGVILIIVK